MDGVLGIEWLQENKAVIDTLNGELIWDNGELDVFYDAEEADEKEIDRTKSIASTQRKTYFESGSLVKLLSSYKHLFTTEVSSLPGAKVTPANIGAIHTMSPIGTEALSCSKEIEKTKCKGNTGNDQMQYHFLSKAHLGAHLQSW